MSDITYSTAYGNRGEYLDHDDVVGMPVVGAAPGTPAEVERLAEVEHTDQFPPETPPLHVDNEAIVMGQYYADKANGRPLSIPDGQRVAELVVAGRKSDAIRLATALGMPPDKALAYVESLPEYQTFLNHRPVEDAQLPGWERDLLQGYAEDAVNGGESS